MAGSPRTPPRQTPILMRATDPRRRYAAPLMKATKSCPKCASKHLLVVPDVAGVHHDYPTMKTVPMQFAMEVRTNKKGVFASATEIATAGRFEAWVCAKCGFTEWYVKNVSALAALAARSSTVKVVGGDDDESGPYRG